MRLFTRGSFWVSVNLDERVRRTLSIHFNANVTITDKWSIHAKTKKRVGWWCMVRLEQGCCHVNEVQFARLISAIRRIHYISCRNNIMIMCTTDVYIFHVPAPPPFANSLARLRSRSALVGLGGGTGFKAIILRWCVERSLLAPKTTDRPPPPPPPPPAKWLMLRADDRSRPLPPPKAVAAPSSRVIELALPGDRRDELDDPGRLQGVRSRGDTMVGIRSVFRLAAFRSALPSPPSKHIYVTHVQTRCTVTSRKNHQ